jgi:hypothetical protein
VAPQDSRGDWARLADFYAPLIAARSVTVSGPVQSRYSSDMSNSLMLSQAELASLCGWLLKLTNAGGDNVAGGHSVLAATFQPEQAHVLFECDRDSLSQVVGRLKSRLATLVLFDEKRVASERKIWGGGFWFAEVLEDGATTKVKEFIYNLDGAVCSGVS